MTKTSILLKELREEQHMTQSEVSKILGVARSTYTGYEIGKIEIPIDKLQKIATYFNVSLDYLVGNKSNKFIQWNMQLPLHRLIKNQREESEIDISTFAKSLDVTPDEITNLEKGLLYPATSEIMQQIKHILHLSDHDLFHGDNITMNTNTLELERIAKERNYHIHYAKTIEQDCEEKTTYILNEDGEEIPYTLSPNEQAKDYLLKQLKSLSLDKLIELYSYSYQSKIDEYLKNIK